MGKHRKIGRPKKVHKPDKIYGCARKLTVYRMRKGRVQKVQGYKHKACVK